MFDPYPPVLSHFSAPTTKMPAVASSSKEAAASKENSQSLKVLEELVKKLTISKAQDEINASALEIATFINGEIEEKDAPTQ